MKIAYQGIPGSYSESCAKKMYPDCETISCKTFDECFEKSSENSEIKAIIPESKVGEAPASVTVCPIESKFVQITKSPTTTVTEFDQVSDELRVAPVDK